jgi:hypothetical protein
MWSWCGRNSWSMWWKVSDSPVWENYILGSLLTA